MHELTGESIEIIGFLGISFSRTSLLAQQLIESADNNISRAEEVACSSFINMRRTESFSREQLACQQIGLIIFLSLTIKSMNRFHTFLC